VDTDPPVVVGIDGASSEHQVCVKRASRTYHVRIYAYPNCNIGCYAPSLQLYARRSKLNPPLSRANFRQWPSGESSPKSSILATNSFVRDINCGAVDEFNAREPEVSFNDSWEDRP
jgi:hypothetical protein